MRNMATKKKKPAPKPVPRECVRWAVIGHRGIVMATRPFKVYAESLAKTWSFDGEPCFVIRVRIVPVAAKRRKGGK